MTQYQFLSEVKLVAKIKDNVLSLPDYLLIAEEGTVVRPLALSEMQKVSSGIWTRVADFISYDGNRKAKCASLSVRLSSSALMRQLV